MFIEDKLKLKENFSANECDIADYLLENEEFIKRFSVRYIANMTYTSPSAVVRLCKKIGCKGFNDFKEEYIKELKYKNVTIKEIDPNYPFNNRDNYSTIANKIGVLYKEIVDDTLSLINANTLTKATELLMKAKVIYICSSGIQAELASAFEEKMSKIGKTVVIGTKVDRMFYEACYADENSCFLMISYSGETEYLLRIAKKIRERRIPAIAITSFGDNTLSQLITCSLWVSTREKLINNLGNFGMNISTLFLLDILYSNCFNINYERNIKNKIKYSFEYEEKRYLKNSFLKGE